MLNIHWKDWCWSWSSNTLDTWCEELTLWERPWCWEILKAGGEGDDRGWDSWMASLTRRTWVWKRLWELVMNRKSWCAAFHGVAKSWTWLSNWTELTSFWLRELLLLFTGPTLCDPTGCILLGFPVLGYLLEFAQIHGHWVGDAI